jgi:hypothetical protein
MVPGGSSEMPKWSSDILSGSVCSTLSLTGGRDVRAPSRMSSTFFVPLRISSELLDYHWKPHGIGTFIW